MDFNQLAQRIGTHSYKWDKVPGDMPVCTDKERLPVWVADMDFVCAPEILEAVSRATECGVLGYKYNSDDFFDAVIGWMYRRHGLAVDREWIVPIPGVVSGISSVMAMLTEQGDEIIIQPPVYPAFFGVTEGCGRVVLENRLIERCDDGVTLTYDIDFDNLESLAARPTAKMMILCSPHNPIGRTFTEDELSRIVKICRDNNVFLVSDEIHSDIVFADGKFTPILSLTGNSAGVCQLSSPSKSFNTAGTSTAYMIIPDKAARERVSRFWNALHLPDSSYVSTEVISAAYNDAEYYVDELCEYIEDNTKFMMEYLISNIEGVRVTNPNSTYLMWVDMSKCKIPAEDVVSALCRNGVITNPGESFHKDYHGYVRINLASPRSLLEKVAERIKQTFDDYGK